MLNVLLDSWGSIFKNRFHKTLSNCKKVVILQKGLNYARALKLKSTFLQFSLPHFKSFNRQVSITSLFLGCPATVSPFYLPFLHLHSSFEISWGVPASSTILGAKLTVAFSSCTSKRMHIVPPPRAPKAIVPVKEEKRKFT